MGKWGKIHKIQKTWKHTNIHKIVATVDWVAGIKQVSTWNISAGWELLACIMSSDLF